MTRTATRERLTTPGVVRVLVAFAAVLAALATVRSETTVRVRFLYTDDAEGVVGHKVREFDGLAFETSDGHRIVVDAEAMPSGVVVNRMCGTTLSTGCEQPAIWLPAASTWLHLLDPSRDWVEEQPTSILLSPQVLVMQRQVPGVLGKPADEVTLADVLDPDARLVFAHARPDSSTSGFHAAIAEFTLAGEASLGGIADAVDPVARFERAVGVVCIKSNELFARASPGRVFDVAYMQETTYAKYSGTRGPDDPELAVSYPSDAMYVADYPLTVLSEAPWVRDDPVVLEAANRFKEWLVANVTLPDADDDFYRTASDEVGSDLHKVPGVRADYGRPTPLPNGDVLRAVQDLWPSTQRPIDVALILDTSAELAPSLAEAKAALSALEDNLDGVDTVLTIDGAPTETAERVAEGDWRTPLRRDIDALQPSGDPPRLWEEILAGLDWLGSRGRMDHQRLLVVLTTGTTSEQSPKHVVVKDRMFVVQMGNGSETGALANFADVSGGRVVSADFDEQMANVAEGC